ncbi:MAG TPA: hypothetical protein VJH71_02085 [Candidatus Paceibacterota bacterium]
MALQDLIINNDKISTDLVESLLKGRVELIQEGKRVNLTKEGMRLSNKARILLLLAGGKAWELLDTEAWASTPGDMQELLGIQGNTLRPILRGLADSFLVRSEKGKYSILSKGIYELEGILEGNDEKNEDTAENVLNSKKQASPRKTNTGPSKSKVIEELISEGYFADYRELSEIQSELGRRGLSTKLTSLPPYILPLVRNKTLTREYRDRVKGKGKVWVYKLLKK